MKADRISAAALVLVGAMSFAATAEAGSRQVTRTGPNGGVFGRSVDRDPAAHTANRTRSYTSPAGQTYDRTGTLGNNTVTRTGPGGATSSVSRSTTADESGGVTRRKDMTGPGSRSRSVTRSWAPD